MALRELHTALFRQFNPLYEDYSAVIDAEWLKKFDRSISVAASSSGITKGKHPRKPTPGEKPAAVQPNRRPLEHLDAFFRKYPQFRRDPTKSVVIQISDLRKQEGPKRKLWDVALSKYQNALVQQFNASYGTDPNDLETWHRVLRRIHAGELPQTLDKCQKVSAFISPLWTPLRCRSWLVAYTSTSSTW